MIQPKLDWKPTDFEQVEDFTRQADNIEYIMTVSLPSVDYHPPYEDITLPTCATFPTPSFINQIEYSLQAIENSGIALEGWQTGRIWQEGEAPSYIDFQRWEQNALVIYNTVGYIISFYPYAGMYYSGGF